VDWQRRERLLITGAPVAVLAAFSFLPVVVYLVIFPAIAHGRVIGTALLPVIIVAELFGVSRLAGCFLPRHFDLITFFALVTLIILVVIAVYTGLFFAALAGRM
jgi:hypothetical protein